MKKVISLILATLMLVSMFSFVSAATSYGTFTFPELTTSDVKTGGATYKDYYEVEIKLKDLQAIGDDFVGYDGGIIDIVYDTSKLIPGKIKKSNGSAGTYGLGSACKLILTNEAGEPEEYEGMYPAVKYSTPNVNGVDVVRVTLTVVDGVFAAQSEAVVATAYFTPIEGATGDAELSLGSATGLSGNAGTYEHKTFTVNKGKINLGAAATEYTVTASANEYGSVNKASQTTVGGAASITATGDVVNEGEVTYVIDDILVNNVTIGETALAAYKAQNEVTYPLTGVAADTSVKFIFKPATEAVSYLRKLTPYTGDDQDFNNAVLIGGQFVPGSDAAEYVGGIFGVEAHSIKEDKTVYYPANDISDYGFFFVGLYDGVYRQGISESIVDEADGLRVFAETADGETKIFDKEN